jgi:predicted GIY-YIG superfamily endonuclease
MSVWHVYVVRAGDGSLYTGIATDVARRLAEHRESGRKRAKYLRGKAPFQLAFQQPIGSRALALTVERRIKRLAKWRKERLVEDNPDPRQLLELLAIRRLARVSEERESKVARQVRNRDTSEDLEIIPGIGPSLADDLRALGINRPSDLRGRDAGALYDQLSKSVGTPVDRCVLYAFRCAVYFADHPDHEPELLKWWNWTDEKIAATGRRIKGTR